MDGNLWASRASPGAATKKQQWPQDWKRLVFIPIPKKGNAKECSNYHTIALISHTSKVMLKILQARLQQYLNREFPDVQARLGKGRGTRDQIANIHWIMEKEREFQKNIFIDYIKAFDCVDHSKAWKILRDGSTRPPYLSPEKPVCGSRSNSYNQTWNRLVQNWERSISRLYMICSHPPGELEVPHAHPSQAGPSQVTVPWLAWKFLSLKISY